LDTGVDLTDVFVTAFHAELDPQTGRVDYSDAGHGLAHHITVDGRVQRLPTAGPPLGIVAGYEWPTQTLTLAPGEALLMPTDGVLELFDDDLHRLAAALAELAERAAGDGLEAAFENLASASSVRTDDVTLLVLRRAR
jgi:serine phosphatase RsbU (regulator of sigma subunit)